MSENISTNTLSKSLDANISLAVDAFANDKMLITRKFQNKYLPAAKCCVIYFAEMVNDELINENIIRPVLSSNLSEGINPVNLLEELEYKVLATNNIVKEKKANTIIDAIIGGDTVFLLEGYDEALLISAKNVKTRAITEPESARVVRGPREGFTESIAINITLIRRKIKSAGLRFKYKTIGEKTNTMVCICYIEGIALEEILNELEKRLDQIKIDGILDSGYIQELIRDAPFSPFDTVGYTEKPDSIAGKLLEGRFAILVDGSPIVLTVPYILAEATQAAEDYYNNYIFSSMMRFLRTSSTIIAMTLPSLYLAVVTFHQEFLPTPLLLSIASGRLGVPFPTVLSLAIMLVIFDILREASVRMPSPIGQAMNIVGTLILGQALVEAKLVSPLIIIITAMAGILSLMNITLIGPTIVFRIFFLLATSILGVYGFLFAFLLFFIHLMTLRSFGIPYMLSISTVKDHNFQDVWIRAPWWEMTLRPKLIAAKNLVRQSTKRSKEK